MLYINYISIKWEGKKKSHAQHLPLCTGPSASYIFERCSCPWCGQASHWLRSHLRMEAQPWVYGDRGGFCWVPALAPLLPGELSNPPPAFVFSSSSVKWEGSKVSKTSSGYEMFCVWRWQVNYKKTRIRIQVSSGRVSCLLPWNVLSSSSNAYCFMLFVWRLILKIFSAGNGYPSLFRHQFPGNDCVKFFYAHSLLIWGQ